MAEAIVKLRLEASEYDKKLKQAQKDNANFKKTVDDMVGPLKKWAIGLASVSGAFTALETIMRATEEGADNFDRSVAQCKAGYESFLLSLNTGNWNNFFENLNEAIKGAADLYDKLDALDTIKGTNAGAIAIKERVLKELRLKQQDLKDQGKDTSKVDKMILQTQSELKKLQMQSVKAGREAGLSQIRTTLINYARKLIGGPVRNTMVDKVAKDILRRGEDARAEYQELFFRLREKAVGYKKVYYVDKEHGEVTEGRKKIIDLSKLSKKEREMYGIAGAVYLGEAGWREGITTVANAEGEASSASQKEYKTRKQAGYGVGGGKSGGVKVQGPTTQELDFGDREKYLRWETRDMSGLSGDGAQFYALEHLQQLTPTPLQPLQFSKEQGYKNTDEYKQYKFSENLKEFKQGLTSVSDGVSAGSSLMTGVNGLITQLGGNSSAIKGLTTVLGIVSSVVQIATSAIQVSSILGLIPSNKFAGNAGGLLGLMDEGVIGGGQELTAKISGEDIYLSNRNYTRRTGK